MGKKKIRDLSRERARFAYEKVEDFVNEKKVIIQKRLMNINHMSKKYPL